ncbi:MAG: hypothetical protein HS111_13020 [Kofleriaceae bacterium]|nr:hypothetical protein [Kofleriaceae bacterium]
MARRRPRLRRAAATFGSELVTDEQRQRKRTARSLTAGRSLAPQGARLALVEAASPPPISRRRCIPWRYDRQRR